MFKPDERLYYLSPSLLHCQWDFTSWSIIHSSSVKLRERFHFMWNCHLRSSEVHIYHYLVCPKIDFKPNARPFQIGDRPWDFVFFIRKTQPQRSPWKHRSLSCFSFAVALGSSNHHEQRLALSMWWSIVLNLKRHKSQVLSWAEHGAKSCWNWQTSENPCDVFDEFIWI